MHLLTARETVSNSHQSSEATISAPQHNQRYMPTNDELVMFFGQNYLPFWLPGIHSSFLLSSSSDAFFFGVAGGGGRRVFAGCRVARMEMTKTAQNNRMQKREGRTEH